MAIPPICAVYMTIERSVLFREDGKMTLRTKELPPVGRNALQIPDSGTAMLQQVKKKISLPLWGRRQPGGLTDEVPAAAGVHPHSLGRSA